MNGPFVVAQANVATGPANKKPVRIVKVTKPLDGQAITVDLGYEQQAKLDLTSVANEKMTLVHIGEKLIILFDNNATVTVEPFFDSMGVPRQDLTFEVPGRELSSTEFAALFPITTDQSVLTAAGAAQNKPASGANFSNASVDPLLTPDPLPLLTPEELPNWQVHFETVPLQEVVLPLVEDEPPLPPPPPNPPILLLSRGAVLGIDETAGAEPALLQTSGRATEILGAESSATLKPFSPILPRRSSTATPTSPSRCSMLNFQAAEQSISLRRAQTLWCK